MKKGSNQLNVILNFICRSLIGETLTLGYGIGSNMGIKTEKNLTHRLGYNNNAHYIFDCHIL